MLTHLASLSLIAQLVTLGRLHLCMRICRAQLSRANGRLIAATDMLDVSGPAASAGLLRGRRMSAYEAMGKAPPRSDSPVSSSSSRSSAMGKAPPPVDSAASSRSASPASPSRSASPARSSRSASSSSSRSSATARGTPAEPLLRAAEADIGRLRHELRQLRLERLAVLPEAVFAALEVFGRGRDWTVMEGWCGVLSSLATLARIGAAAAEH